MDKNQPTLNTLSSRIKNNPLPFSLGLIIILLIVSLSLSSLWNNRQPAVSKTPTKEKKTAAVQDSKSRTHTVVSGDTLYLIAEKYYGSGENLTDIMTANHLSNSDLIEVGQKLVIPEVTPKFPTTGTITEEAARTEKVGMKEEIYIVKQGDTLVTVALQAYGDSYAWTKIAEANQLYNPNNLEAGTRLIIPR
ncbi:hypothetical protein A2774_04145 [Candidatus Roizmanbacteria bacterium RIFCSPHIGHO2_01_FULL_39_12c]|uniref:LysM domain-containing protein n=1 Tax=Candidatus Roizmanbacteria bacterium RIFCSPHIGHO2_01_FULL_39_12c TaxID=1802031 RepID=A0A1F7GEI6_9BACT|nr:MAG: hypothetical protein A2774_04145 [Candidatus Roizmanbacteria bacterium RIFCSPHIGHO2_01_FULL_39_12c]OGK48085.1 MAG: hypothetical protein A2963_03960 [Candidatus Roizmanbacteria bacterium RIFCSPLOWO2_01_FULL_40_13]